MATTLHPSFHQSADPPARNGSANDNGSANGAVQTCEAVRSIAPTRTLTGFQIAGMGSFVPDAVVTNEDLEASLGFSSDWIIKRTGIRQRRHAPAHLATSDLCYEAALRCLDDADVAPDEIDLCLVATFTPDFSFPSVGCLLQDRLGLRCGAMDLQAACAGFMYALATGAQFVATGGSRRCLVVGGDCNSRILDPADQKTYPLFGDGAGAVLLTPGDDSPADDGGQGFLAYHLGADGSGGDLLHRPAGGSRTPPTQDTVRTGQHYMHMDGRAVFKWAVNTVTDSVTEILDHAGLTPADVALFVPHQANIRIINAVSDVLGFDRSAVFNNLDRYGNTSAGSIPLALDEAFRAGRIERGDLVLVSGFGAGLTWGTALLRW